jgi:hypothetical protein
VSTGLIGAIWGNAKSTVTAIHLEKQGKQIYLHTESLFGVKNTQKRSKMPVKMDISKVNSMKTDHGYQISYKNRTYFLCDTGKIHNPEVFLAVLRGLPIQLA